VFFTDREVRNFDDAASANHRRYAAFFHHMLERGVYLPPSGFELWTLSTTHGPDEVDRIVEAAASFRG
jgi:glutamate-1-semialdehyde 2,1-aminomutase